MCDEEDLKNNADFIEQLILECPIDDSNPHLNYDYTIYTTSVLEKHHDVEFAKKMNKKLIEGFNLDFLHSNFDGLYSVLLKNIRMLFGRILDTYGNQSIVLSGIHANIHTFGWTGSVIGLFQHYKMCMEQLLNHKFTEVREWATKCIQEFDDEIKRETLHEDYIRFHYQ